MAYADLLTQIANWTAKSNLTSVDDQFVTLAEAKFNRKLRTREMETSLAETAISSGVVARPSGLIEIKAIWAVGDSRRELTPKPLEYILGQPQDATGPPQHFAFDQSNIRFWPLTGTVAAVYYTKITALSAGDNWLYLASPDLYLWGSLEQAYIYLKDEPMALKYGAMTDSLLDELNRRSKSTQVAGGQLYVTPR